MGLIKVKNGTLYRQYITYYEKYYPEMLPAERRTLAFINSNKNKNDDRTYSSIRTIT